MVVLKINLVVWNWHQKENRKYHSVFHEEQVMFSESVSVLCMYCVCIYIM